MDQKTIDVCQNNGINPTVLELIMKALEVARIDKKLTYVDPTGKKHVSTKGICLAFKDVCITNFGGLARVVLKELKLNSTYDIGLLVYKLITLGLLVKSEEDTLDSFKNIYDFEIEFDLDKYVSELP